MVDFNKAFQNAGASGDKVDVLKALQNAGGEEAPQPTADPATSGSRFVHGLADLPTGLGQIAEHVAETPLNWARTGIRAGLNAAGAPDAAGLFENVSTSEFDQTVRQREQDYQQSRQAAKQTGIDWWRLGGQAANPINYLGLGSGAAATATGRIAQGAVQGAATAAAQPSTTPGNFWWDKVKNASIGGLVGGATSALIEGAIPLIKAGISALRRAGTTASADQVVNSALAANKVDPNSIDLNVLAGLKQEAQSALDHGVEPSSTAVANRAMAESLPVPVKLMRGQATGEAIPFSFEQNIRGVTGAGEPITQRLQQQNAAFIENLDQLGAKNAPDPVSTGNILAEKIQSAWDALQSKKDALYASVRNSRGQSAAMDGFTGAQNIRDALDNPAASHAYDLLPANIRATIDDLQDGKLPLTVAHWQNLDKAWGAAARGADGSTANAINTARRILGESQIADDIGGQARQAYMAARQAHAQQMSLIEPKLLNGMPNPNFQPLMKAVVMDGKPPETLFASGFQNAAPSVGAKNLEFLGQIDPNTPEIVGRTLMGEIKRQALSSASDERGTVSQSVLTGWARDPVKAARMDALLPEPQVQTFRNLASVVEAAKKMPVASTVNTSNTGSALINATTSAIKRGAIGQITKRLPIAAPISEGLAAAKTQSAVQGALNPGVTLNSLLQATPSQAASRRLISGALTPAAVAVAADKSKE